MEENRVLFLPSQCQQYPNQLLLSQLHSQGEKQKNTKRQRYCYAGIFILSSTSLSPHGERYFVFA